MPLDALPVLSILDRITDADGSIVSLGSIEFYEAGTTTPRTVYSDSGLSVSLGTIVYGDTGGYPVSTQGGSTKVSIYTGTGAFKVIVKDADGVALITRDNIPGALDTSSFAPESATPETPVSSKTAAYTILTTDQGKLFNCNCTGGSFVMTLPSAVTVGDGWRVGIRHAGTANTVTISAVLSQSIAQPGPATSHITLTGRGETFWLVSDGAGWTIESPRALARTNRPDFIVTDRLTAPPTSPTAGAYYIITGTPTGTWSSYSEHDLLEADGNGGWIRRTPAAGWRAHVLDEAIDYVFHTSTWNAQSNVEAPNTSNLKTAIFAHQLADGTAGGIATTGGWTKRTINATIGTNYIDGCTLASSVITLPGPSKSYKVDVQHYQQRTNSAAISLLQGASTRHYGLPGNTSTDGAPLTMSARIDVSGASDTLELHYYAQSNSTTSDLGVAIGLAGNLETYAIVTITDLGSIQGSDGEPGPQGSDGLDAAYPYQWSTSTSGDPGSGKIAGNNATIASITQLAVSETDSAGGSMAAVIATWDDSTSSVRALVKISKEGATENFHAFRISGAGTDQGSYWTFPVTYVATSGTISNGTNCALLVIEKGDKGDTGATGATGAAGPTGATGPNTGLDYAWATATSGDPGSGKVLANNATLASATAIHISKTGRNSESLGAVIATWDDSSNTTHYGHLRVFTVADRTEYIEAEVTGLTDNSTYYTVAVTVTSANGTPSANDVMAVMFERTGNRGADGAGSGDFVGPASSTDNAIVRFDSTTGKLGQNSTVTVSDTGAIAGVAAITLASNDGGALGASGTAFSDLFLASGGVINWNAGDVTVTHSANVLAFAGATYGYSFDTTVSVGDGNNYFRLSGTTPGWVVDNTDEFTYDRTNNIWKPTIGSAVVAQIGAASLSPGVSDTQALGTAALMWSDLFLASGAVINFNNSNVTLTHSAATLTLAGATSLAMGTSIAVGLGTVELGHASDTTLSRSSPGELAVEGVVVKKVGKETIFVPASAMLARTTNGAASGTAEMTTNKNMFATLDFDTTTQEFAQFTIRMPKSWDESTITAAFTWSHGSTTTNFGVVWALEAVAISDDDAGDVAFGTAQQVADTGGTTNDIYITAATSAITIGGTPAAEDYVMFQVKRVPSDGSDTMAIDARLHGVTVYFNTNASTDA